MKSFYTILYSLILLNFSASAQSWHSLGHGLNGMVQCIEPIGADGPGSYDIYVGGRFTNAGGNEDADYIAWWDGLDWYAVGPGLNDEVHAIAFADGKIYAGGKFTNAGGNSFADYIAYWDGKQWNSLGTGLNKQVNTIAIDGNRVYVGGQFTRNDGYNDYIAYWDGQKWNSLGNGLSSVVYAIAIQGQNVYAGGSFVNAGGDENADYVARWDGQKWKAMDTGFDGAVTAIEINNTDIYAAGVFSQSVAKWNGFQWSSLGQGPSSIWGEFTDLAIQNNIVYAAAFQDGIFRWDGEEWIHFPILPEVNNATTINLKGNNVFIGGEFFLGPAGTYNIAQREDEELTATKDYPLDEGLCVEVFPNPVTDVLYYSIGNTAILPHHIELMDINGRVILSRIKEGNDLHIAHLPAGLYFLKVHQEGATGIAKIVKL